MLKRYKHNPTHLYLDDTAYFITAAIYEKRHLIATHALKALLLEQIQSFFEKYDWQLFHWVILDNHYHIIGQSRHGRDLSNIIRGIHFNSAREILSTTHCEKPVWWNYWDYCLRNPEQEYMIRQNYLLYNPVKHGYVTKLQEYPYSSFHETFEQLGRDRLVKQFKDYPEYKTLQLTEAENDDF